MESSFSKINKRGLSCFTPEVMVITFTLEALFAVYTFIRYGKNRFGKVAALLLLLLSIFQLAESRICANSSAFVWMRIGFAAITLLPVAGLYLISLISHKTHFLRLGYFLATLFMAAFLFVPKIITGALCAGNYVIFNTNQSLYILYGIYYFGFMLLAIWEALEKIHEPRVQSKIITTLQWWFRDLIVLVKSRYQIKKELLAPQ